MLTKITGPKAVASWGRHYEGLGEGRRNSALPHSSLATGGSWTLLMKNMLKLKLQYFGHLMRRVDSLEKTLKLGGFGDRRRRGRQRMRWLDGITDSTRHEFE